MADNCIDPLLQAWVDEYAAIVAEYVEAIRNAGVEFGEEHSWQEGVKTLMDAAEAQGAIVRNARASVVAGPISEACVACSASRDSQTFTFSLKCHRSCYFCFNPNQADYEQLLHHDRDWRGEFAQLTRAGRELTHVALTGGEPLLRPDEARAFFSEARRLWPAAHLRLYTTGDQLTRGMLADLVDAGMNEIRFSVKPDDSPNERAAALGRIRMACEYARRLRNEAGERIGESDYATANRERRERALDVMVEMPVLPGSLDEMKKLLDELEDMGAFGINLLEFCYPFNNWPEFAARGFKVKNPPYPIMYDYEYAGSLPIEGSEEECLKLVTYALDRGMRLGVHYCSLENKHRMQVHEQNCASRLDDPCYKIDAGDFFYKTAKAFGRDANLVQEFLERTASAPALMIGGKSWRRDEEDDCLLFHPRHLPAVRAAGLRSSAGQQVTPAISINILERHGNELMLRELGLQVD